MSSTFWKHAAKIMRVFLDITHGRAHADICDITKHGATRDSTRKLGKSCLYGADNPATNMADCAVLGCKPEPTASAHYLPRDPVLKERWMEFIYKHRLNKPPLSAGLRICSAHFSNDCFVNFFQKSMGFAKRLYLKPDAVPSIYPWSPKLLQDVSISCCHNFDSVKNRRCVVNVHCWLNSGRNFDVNALVLT